VPMKRSDGKECAPLWLLGDSNPLEWENKLKVPFDSRHPIRHNIWTSIYDVVQRHVYLQNRQRIKDDAFYIRNAITDSKKKPKAHSLEWDEYVNIEIRDLRNLIQKNTPRIIFTFGSFSFEFARRSFERLPAHNFGYWNTKQLGVEFRSQQTSETETMVIPLLHRSIAGGHFLSGHREFCQIEDMNYFEYVGQHIAGLLLELEDHQKIWI